MRSFVLIVLFLTGCAKQSKPDAFLVDPHTDRIYTSSNPASAYVDQQASQDCNPDPSAVTTPGQPIQLLIEVAPTEDAEPVLPRWGDVMTPADAPMGEIVGGYQPYVFHYGPVSLETLKGIPPTACGFKDHVLDLSGIDLGPSVGHGQDKLNYLFDVELDSEKHSVSCLIHPGFACKDTFDTCVDYSRCCHLGTTPK